MVITDHVQVWMQSVQKPIPAEQEASAAGLTTTSKQPVQLLPTFLTLASKFSVWVWVTEPISHTCTLAARESPGRGISLANMIGEEVRPDQE